MNRKILTSANGKLMQITLSPWESIVLTKLAESANIPSLTSKVGNTSNEATGRVIRDFHNMLTGN